MKVACWHSWRTYSMSGSECKWKVRHRTKTITKGIGINVHAQCEREVGDVEIIFTKYSNYHHRHGGHCRCRGNMWEYQIRRTPQRHIRYKISTFYTWWGLSWSYICTTAWQREYNSMTVWVQQHNSMGTDLIWRFHRIIAIVGAFHYVSPIFPSVIWTSIKIAQTCLLRTADSFKQFVRWQELSKFIKLRIFIISCYILTLSLSHDIQDLYCGITYNISLVNDWPLLPHQLATWIQLPPLDTILDIDPIKL